MDSVKKACVFTTVTVIKKTLCIIIIFYYTTIMARHLVHSILRLALFLQLKTKTT